MARCTSRCRRPPATAIWTAEVPEHACHLFQQDWGIAHPGRGRPAPSRSTFEAPDVRSLISGLAGLLAVVLLPVALLVAWVSSVGTDTDRFVAEMRPVASSPEVRDALTDRTIAGVQAQLNLPDDVAQQLEPPLRELVGTVLATPRSSAWASACAPPMVSWWRSWRANSRPASTRPGGWSCRSPSSSPAWSSCSAASRSTGNIGVAPQIPGPTLLGRRPCHGATHLRRARSPGRPRPGIIVGLAAVSDPAGTATGPGSGSGARGHRGQRGLRGRPRPRPRRSRLDVVRDPIDSAVVTLLTASRRTASWPGRGPRCGCRSVC